MRAETFFTFAKNYKVRIAYIYTDNPFDLSHTSYISSSFAA